ncbi:MAG: sensor histidine kinase [Bacteroidales bacterium]|nr:sensor histidine kinase [Bacteroidales bacterium]
MDSGISLSYHKRMYSLLLGFIWIQLVCFITFQYVREKDYKSDSLNEQLQLCNIHMLESLNEGLSAEEYTFPDGLTYSDARLTIMDTLGTVLYDNRHLADSLDNHILRPEIQAALKAGRGYNIRRISSSDGRQYFYSATKGREHIVRTAIPYTATLKDTLKADQAFFWTMIGISLLVSIAGFFSTRRLGRTIERLNLYREQERAINEEREKNRLKRQLTNNINHELKTPVASIQVCLETLLSGITLTEEKRQELIERCYTQNERLRRLLADVSLITRIEDGEVNIERETVVINDLIEDIASELSLMPEQEKLDLKVDFNETVTIHGNPSLLGSIFRNLTENAISYSDGKTICIRLLENNADYCRISFEDDGVGVEEKYLPRLFERFYRVDKGRSRQKGGTGLGLSIVKHSVLYHGGTISAFIRPEGGLGFEFTLSKKHISKQ